jgi:carboxyl-terminal processing protease
MPKLLAFLAAWVFLPCLSIHAEQVPYETLPLKDRVIIGSRIYSDIQIYFGHWQGIPGFDLNAEYAAYLDKVLATDDRKTFDLATMAFMAKLQNGHSGFRDPWFQNTYGQQLHFYALPVDGKWIITQSDLPELKVGAVIAALNGEPFESFYEHCRPYISASDESWRRRALFEYPYLFPESFDLTLANGRHVGIHRNGAFRYAGSSHTTIDVTNRDGILIIHIPAFQPPNLETDALEAVKKAGSVKAIIIDVRGNHGGSTPQDLVAALMDRPYRFFAESTPAHLASLQLYDSPGTHTELHWSGGTLEPSTPHYTGPLFILTDGGCFSACEDFVVSFKDNHRATIIGERTAGSSGQPYEHRFENGMVFGLSTKREFLPDGSPFEGVGIAPDIEVPIHVEDLASGRDPALEKTLSLAQPAAAR